MAASPVGMKRFYAILGAVAVVGIGLLGYQLSKPATVSIPANVTDPAVRHGGVPRATSRGPTSAPVEITEYADYQCPFCQTFATLQMPTIEERLIKTGPAPLALPRLPAAAAPVLPPRRPLGRLRGRAGQVLAPARADLRGAVRVGRRRGTRRGIFRRYAGEVGLDLAQVRRLHVARGSTPAGSRPATTKASALGVSSTPDPARGRPALPGPLRLRRHHPAGRFARAARRQRANDLPHGRGAHEPRWGSSCPRTSTSTRSAGSARSPAAPAAARPSRPASGAGSLGVEVALIGVVGTRCCSRWR